MQGGPLMHVIAAKAVAMAQAATEEFKEYQLNVLKNASALSEALLEQGFDLISGGTDNHLLLMDVTPFNVNGAQAQQLLEEGGITVNKNTVPFDPLPPAKASGVRLGAPAVTTRGMGPDEMRHIASLIARVLTNPQAGETIARVRAEVAELCARFPLYDHKPKE
jgi:glycine hydroxymethyltransferase